MADKHSNWIFAQRRRGRNRGQALVMVTVGIAFLLGVLGLVVDVGWGYYRKQVAQAAADSAAIAAVVAAGSGTITCNTGSVYCTTGSGSYPTSVLCSSNTVTGTNLASGCDYGVKNGIAAANITMTANSTSPGLGAAVNYWVKASVSESRAPTFLQAMGFKTMTIGAVATAAAITGGSGGGGGCLYVMDPTASQALYLNGASLALSCGVYINSDNTTNAFQLNSANAFLCYGTGGGSCSSGTLPLNMVSTPTQGKIECQACGCNANTYYVGANGGNNCPTPTYGSAVTDPLASLPALSPYSTPSCTQTNYSWSNSGTAPTLSPGNYCGGIKLTGGTTNMLPGNYYLNGGGLEIEGANTTVTGSGVFFYNTSNGYTAGPLLISGQPNVTLTSPTSGTYQGILFMQDHSVCPSSSNAVNGNSNIKINGTIYLHCTQSGGSYVAQSILYTGESSTGYYSALVVDTIQINGMSNLVLDPTGGSNTGIGLGSGNKTVLIQ